MKSLKKLLVVVLALSAVILGIWFSVDNPQEITLVLLGFDLPEMPLGVVVLGVLLLGASVGFCVSLLPVIKAAGENSSLKRKLKRRDKELERLRKAPLAMSATTMSSATKPSTTMSSTTMSSATVSSMTRLKE
jgi:uncharacterized integral membrane protein